jgi:ribosome recycling factor
MLQKAQDGIKKSLSHLESEFSKLQLGRANPAIVEDVMVEQY